MACGLNLINLLLPNQHAQQPPKKNGSNDPASTLYNQQAPVAACLKDWQLWRPKVACVMRCDEDEMRSRDHSDRRSINHDDDGRWLLPAARSHGTLATYRRPPPLLPATCKLDRGRRNCIGRAYGACTVKQMGEQPCLAGRTPRPNAVLDVVRSTGCQELWSP